MNTLPVQQHLFTTVTFTTDPVTKSVAVNIPFLVKRVVINFAYTFKSDIGVAFLVTSDMVYGDTVGLLNNFGYSDGTFIYNTQTLSADNNFTYIYREPKVLNGNYNFTFDNILVSSITSGTVLIHCEFYNT